MAVATKELIATSLGRFEYSRYSYESIAVGATNTFGVLTPRSARTVRGTIYFLHGGDGTDEQWVQAGLEPCIGDAVMSTFVERGIQIVLPNIGLSFLREPDDAACPSHWRALVDELLPQVEAATATTSASRWITGISMGGCGALSAFLRRPDLFAGCGSHFPGVIDFDPFSNSALHEYAARTRISDTHREILTQCFRNAFAGFGEYARHDPITLASALDPSTLRGKGMYLDVGSADEFGLYAGVMRFAAVCADRGIVCQSHLVPEGRHDAVFLQSRINHMLGDLISA